MNTKAILTAALLSATLVMPADARTSRHHHRHHHSNNTRVVDVNAHAIPPAPYAGDKHTIVVNSAQHAPRRHGVAGAFQRLHQWHMRQRAKLYRSMTH